MRIIDEKKLLKAKNAIAVLKGYPNWDEYYDWISRDGERPDVVALQIEGAMEEVMELIVSDLLTP